MQSKKLTKFYKAYADWLRAGSPVNKNGFERGVGLCTNLANWIYRHGHTYDARYEMDSQFRSELGISAMCSPFNQGNVAYGYECRYDICHLNEERRQWVFDHENIRPSWFRIVYQKIVDWFTS